MRFLYRSLAILALAMVAGLAHSWFVPIATGFGDGARAGATLPDAGVQQPDGGAQPDVPDPPDPEVSANPEGSAGGTDPQAGEEASPPTPPETGPEAADIDIKALGDYITVPEAHAVWQAGFTQGEAFVAFLDARFPEFYQVGHIAGARRLMSHEIADGTGAEVIAWLHDHQPDIIVIYCEGGECDASRNLARQLELLGFSRDKLHVLQPGYPGWVEAHPDLVHAGEDHGGPE